MPSSSSTTATARLEHLLQQQLSELHAIVSATVTASSSSSSSSSVSASFCSAKLPSVAANQDWAAAQHDASPARAAFHKDDDHALLASCASPQASSATSPCSTSTSSSSSSSSSSNDEPYYRLASPPRTTTTSNTTALQAHLSSIQRLLLDSDFHLQQRVFGLWKQKSWHAVRLRRRLRLAFDLLKHRALHTRPQLHMAETHAKSQSQHRFFQKLERHLAQADHRQALAMHGQRATLQRHARQVLQQLIHRVACRKRGELIALQQHAHLLLTSLHAWRSAQKCQQHLRQQESKLLTRCLVQWQHAIRTEERSLEALTINLRARKALSALVNEHKRLKRRADAALYLMATRRMRRMLGRWWVVGCQRRRTMRLRDQLSSTFFYQTLAKQGLAALLRYLQMQKEERRAWGLATGLEARHLAGRTLRGWLWAARQQAGEMEARSKEGAERRMHRRRADAFQQLRLYASRQRQARALYRALLIQKARRRLEESRCWARERSTRRDLLIQHQQQHHHSLLLDFFQRWSKHRSLQLAARRVLHLYHSKLAHAVLSSLRHSLHLTQVAQSITQRHQAQTQTHCLHWWALAATHSQKLRHLYVARGLRRWRLAAAQQRLQRGIEVDLGEKAWRHTIARRGLLALRRWVEAHRLQKAKAVAVEGFWVRMEERRCRTALREWRVESNARCYRRRLEEEAGEWATRQRKARGLYALAECHRRRRMDAGTWEMAEYFWGRRRRRGGLVVLQRLRWRRVVLPAYCKQATRRLWLRRAWGRLVLGHTRCSDTRQRQEQAALLAEGQWEARRLVLAVGQLGRARALTRRAEKVRQRVQAQQLLQSLRRWQREFCLAQGLRRFQRRSQQRPLARVLEAWGGWTAQQPLRRAVLIEIMQKARRAKYFRAWRALIQRRKELQVRARAVRRLIEEGLVQRAWVGGWRVAFEERYRERRAERLFLRCRGLEPWRRWVGGRKEERRRVEMVQSLEATLLLRVALERWGEAGRLLRREEGAVQVLTEWRAARAMRRWEGRVVRARQQRVCEAYHLARHLGYWRRYVRRAQHHQEWVERIQTWGAARPTVVHALVSLFPSGHKQLAWQRWMAWYGRRVQAREAEKCGEVSCARTGVLRSLRRLQELVLTRKEGRVREEFNEGLTEHFRKAKGFCRLRDRLWEERRERRVGRRREVEERLERERREYLREALGRWSVYTSAMQQAREWLLSSTGEEEKEGEGGDKDGSGSRSSSRVGGEGGESGGGNEERVEALLLETEGRSN